MSRIKMGMKAWWCRSRWFDAAVGLAMMACLQGTANAAPPTAGLGASVSANAPLPLIPMPAKVVRQVGEFGVTDETPVIVAARDAASKFAARHFVETLAHTSALRLRVTTGGNKPPPDAIVFELHPAMKIAAPGGYVLDVSPNGVLLRARTAKGLFHGGVTLGQL